MKKHIYLILIVFFTIMGEGLPSFLNASEVSTGVAMMYDWWKPGFMKMENETAAKIFGLNTWERIGGSFMLGPTIKAKIDGDWNLGATFLVGITRNTFGYQSIPLSLSWWSVLSTHIRDDYLENCDNKSKVRRYDLDINVERKIIPYLDLLLGSRFNYDEGKSESARILDTHAPGVYQGMNLKKENYKSWYLGPSVGFGLHYEIKGFSFGLGTSFIFQFGDYFLQKKVYFPIMSYILPFNYKVGFVGFGLDSFVRIAYLIAPINVEIWVGGRYIFLSLASAGSDPSAYDLTYKRNWINSQQDHFYGITFGAAYKFTI